MNTQRHWMAAAATSVAMALALPAAAQPANAPPPRGYRATRTHEVNEPFAHTVADNCMYAGVVQGRLEQMRPRGFYPTDQFRPALTLRGAVRCANGEVQRVGPVAIGGEPMSWNALERRLESAGRVEFERNGRVCTATPRFLWQRDRLVTQRGFIASCRVARGGGPLPYGWRR